MLLDPSRWARARTVIAVAGVGYAAVALGSACLDHYEESLGGCPTPAASEAPRAGSGEGSGAVAAPSAGADCGAPAAQVDAGTGSGSGSAAAP